MTNRKLEKRCVQEADTHLLKYVGRKEVTMKIRSERKVSRFHLEISEKHDTNLDSKSSNRSINPLCCDPKVL
jgi:hypothetical protein